MKNSGVSPMRIIACIAVLAFVIILPPGLEGEGWWKLYFTSPGKRGFLANAGGPENGLVSMIGGAKRYFYGAFYEVSSPRVVEALVGAKKRGVDVKLVTERDTARKRRSAIKRYEGAGIPVVTDGRPGLMHNKFAIADGDRVWTGSYNPTLNDAVKNNNNAILIESKALAGIYTNEFLEMFDDRVFGNRNNPGPFSDLMNRCYVKIGDTNINVHFSPEDKIERIILKRLEKAKTSIVFMAFSFTSPGIAEMIIRRFKKGVAVRGIFERRGARGRHSQYTKLKIEGVPVRLDRNRNNMHHKVIIIDGARVITGSYNFSRSANKRNDENILIIDSKKIAREYLAEFERIW
ncbi:MAG: phospholipase [Spirochaetes bacterium]|nr:phospholipase [Spirochaetota bacterium]